MKNLRILRILWVAPLLFACTSKQEAASKIVVKQFYSALKKNDTTVIYKLYPNFRKLPSHFKSDTITILSVSSSNEGTWVKIKNGFTNIKNKKFEHDIELLVSGEPPQMVISNSRGMYDYKEQELYAFAVSTGCFVPSEIKDDKLASEKLMEAGDLLIEKSKELIAQLNKEIPLTSLKWNKEFGVGTGNAVLENNSNYGLYNLRYILTFADGNGNEVGKNDGYVSYDTIVPHSKRKFEILAIQPKDAKNVDLRIVYDKYFLLDCLKNNNWTGKEYADWKQNRKP